MMHQTNNYRVFELQMLFKIQIFIQVIFKMQFTLVFNDQNMYKFPDFLKNTKQPNKKERTDNGHVDSKY